MACDLRARARLFLSPAMFWGLHAAIAAAGGMAVLVFGGAIARVPRTDA